MMIQLFFFTLLNHCRSRTKGLTFPSQSTGKGLDKDEEKIFDKTNPIRSLSFDSKNGSNYAMLALDRKTDKNRVSLMRSNTPEDPNSYIIAKDLYSSIKEVGENKWRIKLDDVTIGNDKTVFSIQILEGMNIHQTEPFYYDKKAKAFRLLREKPEESFFTTENIVYICLAVLAAIIGLIIGYVMCCKK